MGMAYLCFSDISKLILATDNQKVLLYKRFGVCQNRQRLRNKYYSARHSITEVIMNHITVSIPLALKSNSGWRKGL